MTTKEIKIRSCVSGIMSESRAYIDYINGFGNECAYTDRMIESIITLAVKLARQTDNINLLDDKTKKGE